MRVRTPDRSMDAHERLDGLLDETRLARRSHRSFVVGQPLFRDAEAECRRSVPVVDAVRHHVGGRIVVGRFVFVAPAQRIVRRAVPVLINVHLSAHGTLKPDDEYRYNNFPHRFQQITPYVFYT